MVQVYTIGVTLNSVGKINETL